MRWAHAGLMAMMGVVLAVSSPPSALTPELPSVWREGRQLVAVSHGDIVPAVYQTSDKPVARKRVVPERPARMIDDAVRRRAMEAVRRAMESESSPA